jgi:Domain of unknown function (DUF4265)
MMEDALRSEYVRIVVPLEREPGDGGPEDEWLWAEPLGASRYRIESPPFFAYGLSHGDVVRASEPGDLPRVESVEHKGGHRTLRVALDPDWDLDRPEMARLTAELERIGCVLDTLPPKIAALDVPPEVDVAEVVRILQSAFRDGILLWEWADPRPC